MRGGVSFVVHHNGKKCPCDRGYSVFYGVILMKIIILKHFISYETSKRKLNNIFTSYIKQNLREELDHNGVLSKIVV